MTFYRLQLTFKKIKAMASQREHKKYGIPSQKSVGETVKDNASW